MIRRATINLNGMTGKKREKAGELIDEYLSFMQKVINTLWNHNQAHGRFVDKKVYEGMSTTLTERYKQCAAKQALQIVKSQRKKEKKTKPVIHNASLELDERFVKVESGGNDFDLWAKLSILGGRPIYLPSRKHYHFNKFFYSNWSKKKSCRLRSNKKGLFLDVFFEKEKPPVKNEGDVVGLDCGYRKLAVLSDTQLVGRDMKDRVDHFYRRSKSHLIVGDFINHELNKIDFSNIKTLVVEDLKNVKKNKKGRFSRHVNRLLSNWAYRQVLDKLEMLCEENRVQLARIDPRYTSQVCNNCKVRDKANRKNERYECRHCGWKVDADYNAALNIRDFWLAQGQYGALSENHFTIPSG
ncbi:MAG: transposase [Candidatus Altiarchaeota archaeon]|nr:transposase [Candidatus Altiarchaeota archaeon]